MSQHHFNRYFLQNDQYLQPFLHQYTIIVKTTQPNHCFNITIQVQVPVTHPNFDYLIHSMLIKYNLSFSLGFQFPLQEHRFHHIHHCIKSLKLPFQAQAKLEEDKAILPQAHNQQGLLGLRQPGSIAKALIKICSYLRNYIIDKLYNIKDENITGFHNKFITI